jgi:hypothetical protein
MRYVLSGIVPFDLGAVAGGQASDWGQFETNDACELAMPRSLNPLQCTIQNFLLSWVFKDSKIFCWIGSLVYGSLKPVSSYSICVFFLAGCTALIGASSCQTFIFFGGRRWLRIVFVI